MELAATGPIRAGGSKGAAVREENNQQAIGNSVACTRRPPMKSFVLWGILVFVAFVAGYQMAESNRKPCTYTQATKDAIWDRVFGSSDEGKK